VARRDAESARERHQVRRLRQLLAAVGVALVLALVAGGLAFAQQRRASRNADLAATRAADAETERDRSAAATRVSDINRLVAQARIEGESNRNLGMLLALEANRIEDSPSTRGALLGSLLAEPRLVGTYAPPSGGHFVNVQPDGTVVTVAYDGTVTRFDDATHAALGQPWRPTAIPVNLFIVNGYLAFAPGRVAFTNKACQALVADVVDGRPLGPTIAAPWPVLAAAATFSPDGRTLYLASGQGTDAGGGFGEIQAFDVATAQPIGSRMRAHTAAISSLARSGDGRWLVAGSYDRTASVWDLSTGELVTTLGGVHDPPVGGTAITTDGRYVATSTLDQVRVYIWDRATASLVAGPLVSGSFGTNLAFSPDGSMLADYTGADRLLRVWSVPGGALVQATLDTQGSGTLPAWTADGQAVLTPGPQVRQWSVGNRLSVGTTFPAEGPGRAILSPDGSLVAISVAGPTRGVTLFRTADRGQVGERIVGPPPDPLWAAYSPNVLFDRSNGFYVNWEGYVQRYDASTAEPVGPPLLVPDLHGSFGSDLSPDGTRLAVTGAESQVAVVDLSTGRTMRTITVASGTRAPPAVAFDASGRYLLAYALAFGQFVFDLETGERVASDPGGLNLASGNDRRENIAFDTINRQFVFTDMVTLRPTRPPLPVTANGGGAAQAVSPDGRLLVVNTRNGSQLYDATTGAAIGPPIPSLANITTGSPTFSRDARLLAVARPEGGSYVWQVDPAAWRARACEIAGRNLTAREWAQFLPNSGSHRKTCEQWPLEAG
jgi:WD40 repeat protein